jgi:uncharacterized protein YcaQ
MSQKSSTSISLSLETARILAVVKQGLHQRPPTADKQTLLETIRRIGLLQLDTVNVIARSHYLVMLSRVGLYNRSDLDALSYPDRSLFESWAHAACLIPVEDYEYFAPVIAARQASPIHPYRLQRMGDDPQAVLDDVLAQIKANGPMASKDFEDPREQRGTWWDWKPAKHALAALYDQGRLMVDRRINFQIQYNLPERVLPASAEPPTKTMDDYQRWATLQGLSRLGAATAGQVSDYYRLRTPVTREILETLEAEGAVVLVDIEGWSDKTYLDPADISLVEEIVQGKHQPTLTTFLSPFDNLTWNRERLADLFGFDYRIELYTPKSQRKYGYYVLPILHNGRFVGRLDPKADRKTKTLIVHAIYLEPGVDMTNELIASIADALREFMAFHKSENLTLGRSEPEALRKAVLARME